MNTINEAIVFVANGVLVGVLLWMVLRLFLWLLRGERIYMRFVVATGVVLVVYLIVGLLTITHHWLAEDMLQRTIIIGSLSGVLFVVGPMLVGRPRR